MKARKEVLINCLSHISILWWISFPGGSEVKNMPDNAGDSQSVQSLSCVPLFVTPWIAACQGLPVHHQLLEFTQTHVHRVGDPSSHLILCRPLLFLPPIPPSIRVFSNELTLHMRWPKYWSFSFSIIPSKEHPGPISFRIGGTVRDTSLIPDLGMIWVDPWRRKWQPAPVIPWTEDPGGLQSLGSRRVRHDWASEHHLQ